jgi:hypothetical protein
MKIICIICAAVAIIGCFEMPIGYYTFLRIILTIGAVLIILKEIQKDVNLIGIAFIIVAVLFNPIVPIYLYQKSFWMPIDLVTGILFLFYGFRETK